MTTPLLLLRPDGARPLTERLSFLTDISTALDGSESRVQLRAFPRHSYTSQYTFMPKQMSLAAPSLAMLRYADKVGFPLVMHQLQPGTLGAVGADAGIAESGKLLVIKNDGTTRFVARGAALAWDGAMAIAPYVEGWVNLSRQVTHRGAGVQTAIMTFDVDDLDEVVAPWAGPLAGGKPLWPSRADWSADVSENIEAVADSVDFGHLRLRSIRYTKRVISVSLLLVGRPAILDFRRFVFAIGGAYKPFRYRFEPDGIEKTWRLASDDVSIDYLSTRLARVSLEFLELPA